MSFAEQAVARLQRQRCKACWHDDGFDFNVPDEVWEAVVPEELRNRVVCLRCFDLFAAERGHFAAVSCPPEGERRHPRCVKPIEGEN